MGGIPFQNLGVPDINHLPNPFGAPILTKSTLIGGIGFPEKNKNVFKPDAKTENLVKKLLGLDNKPKLPFNPLAMRLNTNLTNPNTNLNLNNSTNSNNNSQSNSTSDEKDTEEEEEEHISKEKALEAKLNNFSPLGNNILNNPNAQNNLNNNNQNNPLENNNINFPGNLNSINIPLPNLNLNKNLPFRTNANGNTGKNQHDKHEEDSGEEEDDEIDDDQYDFSIKGKSSDFDDMLQENDNRKYNGAFGSSENLFLQKKENLKSRKFKNKNASVMPKLNLNKKISNILINKNNNHGNSFLRQNDFNKKSFLNKQKETGDFLFNDKNANLFVEKNSYANESKNNNNNDELLLKMLKKDEVSQEDFLKTINNYDYLNYESKDSNKFFNERQKAKKEFLYDDEYKLQNELYQMQHNQTLIEEIKKGN